MDMGIARDDQQEQEPSSLKRAPPDAVGEILGLLAHDLRNPLAALSSNVGFLQMIGEELTGDAREAVDDLQLSIEALGRIIDSLELVGNELKDAAVPSKVLLSVPRLVRSILPQSSRAAASHGVQLAVDVSACENEVIFVSELPFQRALSALIHNALTFAPPKSAVRVIVLPREGQVVFRVEDDGVSLAPEHATLALSGVGQTQLKTASRGRYSRGLGLYAVAKNASLAGALFCKAEQPAGSAFEILAPRKD